MFLKEFLYYLVFRADSKFCYRLKLDPESEPTFDRPLPEKGGSDSATLGCSESFSSLSILKLCSSIRPFLEVIAT